MAEIFKKLFCFLVDDTSRHLVYFEALKKDEGYAAAIETAPEQMLSSHAVKRIFQSLFWGPHLVVSPLAEAVVSVAA